MDETLKLLRPMTELRPYNDSKLSVGSDLS